LLYNDDSKKAVVSSEICNKGLEKNLDDLGYKLIQTEVGDRYVVNSTLNNNAILGAEPSGHYFFPNISKSMDGLLALFHFLELLHIYGDRFNNELKKLKHFTRYKKNIQIDHRATIDIDKINKVINAKIEGDKEKFVIRKSMWDPVIRIYYDYEDQNNFEELESLVIKYLNN